VKTLIVLGVLTGLDNLQIAPGLGLAGVARARRWFLALMFGLCEAGMPLLGLVLGRGLRYSLNVNADALGSIVLLSCGALIIWFACTKREIAPFLSNRWTLLGLPLLLSVDNLLAGIGVGVMGQPLLLSALVIGTISTLMCFAGLYLGQILRRFVPRRAELLAGIYLIVLGIAQLPALTSG
jgi:putative Mn2+ efflux pump MntP